MTTEEIKALGADELEELRGRVMKRVSALQKGEEDDAGEDLPKTAEELRGIVDAVTERIAEINAMVEERSALLDKANEMGTVIRKAPKENIKEERKMEEYTIKSPEYRSAFLKTLKGDQLNQEEREAMDMVMRSPYTGTTGDTTGGTNGIGLLIPTEISDKIWSLIGERHAILGDITLYRTNTILSVPVQTSISQGDATAVTEAAANDDEKDVFNTVTLHGKDFSKTVKISYAMAKMSIDALEEYLVNEISERIGYAMARETITQILTDYDSTNNTVTALNSKVTYGDVANAFSKLKVPNGNPVVYANMATIYGKLVAMVDNNNRPIFQPDAQAGAQGSLIGAAVKQEDALSNNVLLVGYPKNVVGNVVQDVMVETARDIEKHVIIYSGYARYESKLVAPKSFTKITVTSDTEAG